MPKKYENSTFGNYQIYDEKQKQLVEFLKQYAAKDQKEKSLVLMGKTGTGKTHLAISLAKAFCKKVVETPSARDQYGNPLRMAKMLVNVYSNYIKADYFFDGCNKAIKDKGTKENYISSLFTADFLIIDDLGINNFTESKAENLYLLIDYADQQEKKFIITTNFHPDNFDKVDPRIGSRLAELAIFKVFNWDDFRRKAL